MAAEKIVLGEGCRMGGDCGFVGEVLVLLGCEKKKENTQWASEDMSVTTKFSTIQG
jgi:hypothetical protein